MKTGFYWGARNFDPESESTDQFGLTENIQQVLLQFLDKIYPGAHNHVDSWWSGILGVGEEKHRSYNGFLTISFAASGWEVWALP